MKAFSALFLLLAGLAEISCQRLSQPSPDFTMNGGELDGALVGLPKQIRENISADPKGFLSLLKKALKGSQDLLVIVDKQHGLGRAEPSDLVALSEYPSLTLTNTRMSLRKVLIPDLLEMTKAADADGIGLSIQSTYRSFPQQTALYQEELKTMSKEEVERELAPPGYSQHQLGTVIDFSPIDISFADTPAGLWLASEGWKFGFTLSYPEGAEARTGYIYEPWHYRYVGRNAAAIIHTFFLDDQKGFLDFYAAKSDFFRKKMK